MLQISASMCQSVTVIPHLKVIKLLKQFTIQGKNDKTLFELMFQFETASMRVPDNNVKADNRGR
jgi:hypothetical protein